MRQTLPSCANSGWMSGKAAASRSAQRRVMRALRGLAEDLGRGFEFAQRLGETGEARALFQQSAELSIAAGDRAGIAADLGVQLVDPLLQLALQSRRKY